MAASSKTVFDALILTYRRLLLGLLAIIPVSAIAYLYHYQDPALVYGNHALLDAEGKTISITPSAGVVEFTLNDEISEAFKRADQRLYRAKQGGRNRIEAT